MTAELLAESFVSTAQNVLSATDAQTAAALAHAARFERRAQMAPAVRDLVDSIEAPAQPGGLGDAGPRKTSVPA
jgi:hypothetical protein